MASINFRVAPGGARYLWTSEFVFRQVRPRLNPLFSRLTQDGLKAVVPAVSVSIEEGHVIILHIPVGIHHRSVGW